MKEEVSVFHDHSYDVMTLTLRKLIFRAKEPPHDLLASNSGFLGLYLLFNFGLHCSSNPSEYFSPVGLSGFTFQWKLLLL